MTKPTSIRDKRPRRSRSPVSSADAAVRTNENSRVRSEELAHRHRLYTAGEFAAVMAHELNQPLAAIAGYSEAGLQLMRRGKATSSDLIDKLEHISLQAQRAGRIIQEMRKYLCRSEHQDRKRVDLDQVIEVVIELLEAQADADHVRFDYVPSADSMAVLASDVKIEQVLVNLLQNAMESIRAKGGQGGTIAIRAVAELGNMARVTVLDDGVGFDGVNPEQLFDRFYTTKAHGLGIGLAISRAIIEECDGRIFAEKPEGGGAVFHFTLPLFV